MSMKQPGTSLSNTGILCCQTALHRLAGTNLKNRPRNNRAVLCTGIENLANGAPYAMHNPTRLRLSYVVYSGPKCRIGQTDALQKQVTYIGTLPRKSELSQTCPTIL